MGFFSSGNNLFGQGQPGLGGNTPPQPTSPSGFDQFGQQSQQPSNPFDPSNFAQAGANMGSYGQAAPGPTQANVAGLPSQMLQGGSPQQLLQALGGAANAPMMSNAPTTPVGPAAAPAPTTQAASGGTPIIHNDYGLLNTPQAAGTATGGVPPSLTQLITHVMNGAAGVAQQPMPPTNPAAPTQHAGGAPASKPTMPGMAAPTNMRLQASNISGGRTAY